MKINYNNYYFVLDGNEVNIGIIDGDEFVRSGTNLLYRIDGDEVYALDGQHLGYLEDGIARATNGDVIFRVCSEK